MSNKLQNQISELMDICREQSNRETNWHIASLWARAVDSLVTVSNTVAELEKTQPVARVVDPYIFMD